MTDTLYAFALVVDEPDLPLPDGPGDGQVESVRTELGFVLIQRIGPETVARLKAAENAAGLRAVTDWILCHERVTAQACAAGPAYPFGFATLFSSDAALRQALAGRAEMLSAFLAHVAGADEWAIKVCARKSHDTRSEDASLATGGRDYLLRRKARSNKGTASAMDLRAAEIAANLRHMSRDWKVLRPGLAPAADLDVIGTFAALVDRAEAEAFSAQARAQADAFGEDVSVSLTGPWPAFSFRPTFS